MNHHRQIYRQKWLWGGLFSLFLLSCGPRPRLVPTVMPTTTPNQYGLYLPSVGLRVEEATATPSAELTQERHFVAVVPYSSLLEETTSAELLRRWQSTTPQLAIVNSALAPLTDLWGEHGTGLRIVSADQLAETVQTTPDLWGMLSFAQLTPNLKVLAVDGMLPIDRSADLSNYPLRLTLPAKPNDPPTDRDLNQMSTVILTGVTAFVRATAYEMEQNGITYPAEEVAGLLQSADFAHISNEVSFYPDCPYPDRNGGTSFCSDPRYAEILTYLGVDLIELTGNHLNDYGTEPLLYTLDLYEEMGLRTFGGGRSADAATQPLLIEHHGNKLAFLGCNSFGPEYAWATETDGGARPCDAEIYEQIGRLRDENYLVIITLQDDEIYFYTPFPDQISFFQSFADAGATIVSGSSGHHAQEMVWYNQAILHYGLGNLFFDQMDDLGTRYALLDEYIFYQGRLLSLRVHTGLIENYARPRGLTSAERQELWPLIFPP